MQRFADFRACITALLLLERITKQEILENPCFLIRDRCQVSSLIFSEFKQIDEQKFPQKSSENLFFHDFSGSLILAAKFGDDPLCKVENSNLIRDFRKPLTISSTIPYPRINGNVFYRNFVLCSHRNFD